MKYKISRKLFIFW